MSNTTNTTIIAALPCSETLSLTQLANCCLGNTSTHDIFATNKNVTVCYTNDTTSFTSCVQGISFPNICICEFTDQKPLISTGYTGQCGDNGDVCNANAHFSCNGTQPIFISGAEHVVVSRGGWITFAIFALLLIHF